MSWLERWARYGLLILLVLLTATGCTPREGPVSRTTKEVKDEEDPPPHGGKLFAVPGHNYHGELVIEEKGKRATLYLFDSKVRNPVPTKAETFTLTIRNGTPLQITLKAERQEKDPMDASSRFVGTHDRLGSPVDYEKVELDGLVEGKPYTFRLDKE
jgi:hypothetical protein